MPSIVGPPERVLVVNAGSRTVKLRVVAGAGAVVASTDLDAPGPDLADKLAPFLRAEGAGIDAVGHRVVHGGPAYTDPVVVDDDVRSALETLNDLAPLHNPPALVGIDAVRRLLPEVPSVACFDTAFHAGLPPAARSYALPAEWAARWEVRRYGFHGLSCAWATGRAAEMVDRPVSDLRLAICHLGGGASVTGVVGGASVDTTMGFTPLEGLVMATRVGDLDPGALLWMLQHGLDPATARDLLEHRAGLLGLSGDRSSDTRDLLAARDAGDEAATLAIAVYVHRLRAKIAAMAAASGGLDVLVFSGGVGEHAPSVRAEAAAGLDWMGVTIDADANAAVGDDDVEISGDGPVRVLVIHAREDLQIREEVRRLLAGHLSDSGLSPLQSGTATPLR